MPPDVAPPTVAPVPDPNAVKFNLSQWIIHHGMLSLIVVIGGILAYKALTLPTVPVDPAINPAPIVVPSTLSTEVGHLCKIKVKATGSMVKWTVAPEDGADFVSSGNDLLFVAYKPGTYIASAFTIVNNTITDPIKVTIVALPAPRPPPPTPTPTPTPPTPTPPTPTPPPAPDPPSPIAAPGLRVMIKFDPLKKDGLTPDQKDMIFKADFLSYLDARCVLESDGKTHAYRIWPVGSGFDPSGDDKLWRDAYAVPGGDFPQIIVANGKTGFVGKLPETMDATKALIDRYQLK